MEKPSVDSSSLPSRGRSSTPRSLYLVNEGMSMDQPSLADLHRRVIERSFDQPHATTSVSNHSGNLGTAANYEYLQPEALNLESILRFALDCLLDGTTVSRAPGSRGGVAREQENGLPPSQ